MANGTTTKSASKTVSPSGGKPQQQTLKAKPVLITPLNPRTGKPSGPTRVGSSRGPIFRGKTTEDLPFVDVEQKPTPVETKPIDKVMQPVQRFEASKFAQQRTAPEVILGKQLERKVATVQKVIPGTRIPFGAPKQLVQGTVKSLEKGNEVVVSRAEFEALQKERIKIKSTETLTATEVSPGKIAIKKELSPEGKQAFEIVRDATPGQRLALFESALFSKKGTKVLGSLLLRKPEKVEEAVIERQAEIISAQKEGESTFSLSAKAAVQNPFTKISSNLLLGFGGVKALGTKIGSKILGTKTAKSVLALGAGGFLAKEGATTIKLIQEGETEEAAGRAFTTGASLAAAFAGGAQAARTVEALKPKEIRGIRITEKVEPKAAPFQRVENLEQLSKDIRVDVSKTGKSTLFTKVGKQGFAKFQGRELTKPNPDVEIITGARSPQAQAFDKDKFFLFKTRPVDQVLRTSADDIGSVIDVRVQSQVGVPVSTTPPKDLSGAVFRIKKFAGTGRDLFVEKGASPLVSKLTGGRIIFKPGNIGKSLKSLFKTPAKDTPVITTTKKPPKIKLAPSTDGGRITSSLEQSFPQSQIEVFESPIALPTPSKPFVFVPDLERGFPDSRIQFNQLSEQTPVVNFGTRQTQIIQPREEFAPVQTPRLDSRSQTGSLSLVGPVQTPISELKPIQSPIQVQRPIQSQRPIQRTIRVPSTITTPTPPTVPKIPKFGFGKKSKKSLFGKSGFDVLLKIKGKFKKIDLGGRSLERKAALALGASKVERSALRTFKLVPSKAPVERSPLAAGAFTPGRFREPKGRSAKDRDIFVEKSKFAINTAGERIEITEKGINAKLRTSNKKFNNVFNKRARL